MHFVHWCDQLIDAAKADRFADEMIELLTEGANIEYKDAVRNTRVFGQSILVGFCCHVSDWAITMYFDTALIFGFRYLFRHRVYSVGIDGCA